MDNTKVPPTLIYRERRSLEEFIENSPLNEALVDNMSNIYYLKKNFKERACRCMNTAYYICTLMLKEKHPEWCFDLYCDYAFCKEKNSKVNQAVTLSLVSVFIDGMADAQRARLQKLKTKIDNYMISITNFIEIGDPFLSDYCYADVLRKIKEGLPDYSVNENEFVFRVIDKEAVRDVMAERSFNWVKFVDFFRESRVRELVDYYGSTEDEKHNMVDILRQAANGFYTTGVGDKPEQVKMLDAIDNEIQLRYNSQAKKKNFDTGDAEVESIKGSANYEAIIRELEVKLQHAQAFIEEITQEVEKLTAEQKVRMAFALELLRAAGLTTEMLEKQGNKAKVATIITLLTGIESQNKRGNKAQTCQTFLSDPRYFPRDENMDTLKRLNNLCVELGINACLSLQSQSNKKA